MSQRGGRWLLGQRARGGRGLPKESHCSPLCSRGRRARRRGRALLLLDLILLLCLLFLLCLQVLLFLCL